MHMLSPVIPATQETEIRRITVQGWPGQKVPKIPSPPIKAGCGGMHLHLGYMGGINRRIMHQADQDKNNNKTNKQKPMRPYSKK
jgi:hypothetical protein